MRDMQHGDHDPVPYDGHNADIAHLCQICGDPMTPHQNAKVVARDWDRLGVRQIVKRVKMPAGRYWVGDPCYSIKSQERWMEWLEAANYMTERILLADIDGMPVLGVGTAHGDGTYKDQEGHRYPVDAGLLGLVPQRLVPSTNRPDLVRLVHFTQEFSCYRHGGTVVLGHIRIKTG